MSESFKSIKTTNTNFEVSTEMAMIAKVGSFKFVKEDDYPWIDVFLSGDEEDTLLDQVDDEEANSVIDLKDLEIFALNWVFKNVEVVKEIGEDAKDKKA